MTLWADYSAGYPGAANLAAAGFTGAIRYIGKGSEGKQLQEAERADFDAHGFRYLLVCELDTHDAEGGYAAGQAFGLAALADARAQGVPDSVGIACAADEHLTAAQIPTAVEYARGFRDVVGAARMGVYGFSEFVAAARAAGIGSWFWQCGNPPSTTGTSGFVTFWQRNGYAGAAPTAYVAGVQCDISEQLRDLGIDMDANDVITADGLPDSDKVRNVLWYGNKFAKAAKDAGEANGAKLDALTAAVAALAAKPAAVVTVTPEQLDGLKAAVVDAVHSAPAAVSPEDKTAIATAVVAALGAKLAA